MPLTIDGLCSRTSQAYFHDTALLLFDVFSQSMQSASRTCCYLRPRHCPHTRYAEMHLSLHLQRLWRHLEPHASLIDLAIYCLNNFLYMPGHRS